MRRFSAGPKYIDGPFSGDAGLVIGIGIQRTILKSKAVGEPPLMYGIGAYFALQNAIKSFNPSYKLNFHAPMTPEKVLLGLYQE